ncbi:nucleotide-binding alpha-beta plait domain-containing protein [Tanacetum coccineum]
MNRLPVKSLLQFRVVSKQWKFSIDSFDFIRFRNFDSNLNVFSLKPVASSEGVGVGEFSPPYYISQLGDSLIISGSFGFGAFRIIYAWALDFEDGKSYAHVLNTHNSFEALDCESVPSIVLDDDCLNSRDLSKTLLGRIKELASLSNLKKVLKNEGFDEIKLQYMGELWVLLEFPSAKIKELFQENRGAGSWFSVLKQTPIEFIPEGRILWVEIEGVPFKLWSKNTFKKIASKWGEILDTEDQEEDGFYTKRLCIYSKFENNIYENFKVIFRGKETRKIVIWDRNLMMLMMVDKVPETELDETLEQNKSPSEIKEKDKKKRPFEDMRNVNDVTSPKRIVEEEQNEQEWNNANKGSKDEMSGSVCSGLFKKSVAPQSGGSILCVLEELVKVGQAMGYNMKGCVNNISEIIESQGASGVNR